MKEIINIFNEEVNGKTEDYYIYAAHARNEKSIKKVKDHILQDATCKMIDLGTSELGPVVSVHVGPGTVGISWAPKFF